MYLVIPASRTSCWPPVRRSPRKERFEPCAREVLGQYLERWGKIHLMGVRKAAGPNRFRYWDLKEGGTDVPLYGFSMPT
jgi:hypothetical protein